MAAQHLETLVSQLSERSPSHSICASILALLRESRLPRPDLVLRFGDIVQSRFSDRSREYWDVAEQICQAAADVGEFEIMDSVCKKIIDRFRHSTRSFVLLGCTQEAKGQWKKATDNYINVISEQPMAPFVYKRQVAVLKSEMKTQEAVSMLNYYLSIYSDDKDAWAELCALCLSLARFSHALFAANELVIHDPGNYAYQSLVADVYITCGGNDNLLLARGHYACSLKARKNDNLKALYGLWLACSLLSDKSRLVNADEISKNNKLLSLAKAGVSHVYDKIEAKNGSQGSAEAAKALMNSKVEIDNS